MYVTFLLWRRFYLLLNKCFILDKQHGGQCWPSSCLLANVIGKFQNNSGQPYDRLTLKCKIARKETLLSWHLLCDSIHLKWHKVCIKSNVMFLENILLGCGNYVSKMTSKSSITTNVPSNIQFLIFKWFINDSKCEFTLFYSRISRSMTFYLIDGNKYWSCFLMQILTRYFERFMMLVIQISPELNQDFECRTQG